MSSLFETSFRTNDNMHRGAIYSSLRSLFVRFNRFRESDGWLVHGVVATRDRSMAFRGTIRIPAGRGEQWRLRRERLPSLDVSFPPTGRKFPFPYGGVCLSLAAGQSGQTRGKRGEKGKWPWEVTGVTQVGKGRRERGRANSRRAE